MVVSKSDSGQQYDCSIIRFRHCSVLNSRTGKDGAIRMENFLPGQPNERAGVYADLIQSMNESWGSRLGLLLPCPPIVAQYIKMTVVNGILRGKIIGTLYFAHWILLEILVTLANMCPMPS